MKFLIAAAALGVSVLSATATSPSTVVTSYGSARVPTPMVVGNLPNGIKTVQAANYGGLALSESGNVYSWDSSSDPKAVVSIGEGAYFGAAATRSGDLWVRGNDREGKLCNGQATTNMLEPAKVKVAKHIVEVSGGGNHLLLLTSAGTVEACGSNWAGQLGNGKFSDSDVPVKVEDLSHIVQVSAGSDGSMALDSSGRVWTWGQNNFGQLGDGATANSDLPVEVGLPAPAVLIFAGGDCKCDGHELVLLSNGQVWAWGDNDDGQLGNGTEPYSDVPVQVEGLNNVTEVAAGGSVSYALESSGKVWKWGGAIGDGAIPVASGFTQISAVAEVFVGLHS
jgi:alpha-tubulin suppressor-like RCC1 family protein